MSAPTWGLMGPDSLESERRTRTLGLGAAVREFNDLAVPGMGGVWFGKQLFLAALGVAIAEGVRQSKPKLQNIPCANAVEALGCLLAFQHNQWQFDARLSGRTKLNGKSDLWFSTVSKPSFYVTQPMRMTTVQPLPALGLVTATGERFNSFAISAAGRELVDLGCAESDTAGAGKTVQSRLAGWAMGSHNHVKTSDALRAALSPHVALSGRAREFLRERLQAGTSEQARRRKGALAWADELRRLAPAPGGKRRPLEWSEQPAMLSAPHWQDLQAGALFFALRDAAVALLDGLESMIGNRPALRIGSADGELQKLSKLLGALRDRGQAFLALSHDPSPESIASTFAEECIVTPDQDLFENLVKRDDRVLRLRDRMIIPGSAFKGAPSPAARFDDDDEDADDARKDSAGITQQIGLPDAISRRVANLFLLNLDLHDELSPWLAGAASTAGAN